MRGRGADAGRRCVSSSARAPTGRYYSFLCTTCQDEIRKPADDEVVTLLVSGGVIAEHWVIPAEALEEHHGAAITYDDVLDFALGLDRVHLLAAMITPRVQA